MAIKLPTQLKIGAHTYTVNREKVGELGQDSCGKHDSEKNVITVDDGLADTQKVEALFHEIFHALNGELSETDVEWLAQGMTQVLLDNKLLNV